MFAGQHFLPDGMTMLQPGPVIGRLAAECPDMTLGVGILLLALHNPVEVAETWASMDVVSEGRLVFGVGLGYRKAEYDAFGSSVAERVRRFECNLALVRRLWSGEAVTSDLPWCRLNGATLGALPLQQPLPPIWVAANADPAVRRAARLGDTWLVNPHAAMTTVARQLDLFTTAREAAGLPPVRELPAIREVCCARTRELAFEKCERYLSEKYVRYTEWGQDKAMPTGESFRAPLEELAQDRFIIGSPEDCTKQLLPWRHDLGVDHFLFRADWAGMPLESSLETIHLLTTEVLPELRRN